MRKVSKDIIDSFLYDSDKKKTIGNSRVTAGSLYLFDNEIARKTANGFEISNQGYFTATTKERLNALPNVSIQQKKGDWYLNGNLWDGKWIEIKNNSVGKVEEKTKVKFFYNKKNDDLFAVIYGYSVSKPSFEVCYSHVGQHSECSKDYIKESSLAKLDQYNDLYKELKNGVGYENIEVLNPDFSNGLAGLSGLSTKAKVIGGSVIAALGVIGTGLYIWGKNKKSFADQLVVTQSISVKTIEKKSFIFVSVPWVFDLIIVPTIKNPSKARATVVFPYVEIRLFKDDVLPFASSILSNTNITVEPSSQITFDGTGKNPIPIVIRMSTQALVTKASSILQNAIKTKSISLFTTTKTFLVTAAGKLPIINDDKIEFKF